jgi:hypothetical protein
MGVELILEILQAALGGLAALGKSKVSVDAGIATSFVAIVQKAQAAYEAATGAPLDLTKIPIETPVP